MNWKIVNLKLIINEEVFIILFINVNFVIRIWNNLSKLFRSYIEILRRRFLCMYENIFLMKYVYFNFEIVIMLLGLDIVVVIMIWVEFVGSWFCVIF